MGRRAYGSGWGDNYACLIVIDRLKNDAAKMQEQLVKLRQQKDAITRQAQQLAGALNYVEALVKELVFKRCAENIDESRGDQDDG